MLRQSLSFRTKQPTESQNSVYTKPESVSYMGRNMTSTTRPALYSACTIICATAVRISHPSTMLYERCPVKDHPRPRSLASKFLSRTKMTRYHQGRPLRSDLGLFLVAKCCPGRLLQAAMIYGSSLSYLQGLLVVHVRTTSGIISYEGCHRAHIRWRLVAGN